MAGIRCPLVSLCTQSHSNTSIPFSRSKGKSASFCRLKKGSSENAAKAWPGQCHQLCPLPKVTKLPGRSCSRESWAQTRGLMPFLPAQCCRKSQFSSGATHPFYELQSKRKKKTKQTHTILHREGSGENILQTLLI